MELVAGRGLVWRSYGTVATGWTMSGREWSGRELKVGRGEVMLRCARQEGIGSGDVWYGV